MWLPRRIALGPRAKAIKYSCQAVRCVFYVWEVVLVNMWANGSCAWLHTELEQLRAQRIEGAPHLQRRVVQLDRWAVSIWTSAVEDEYGCPREITPSSREITCAEPMCTCESCKCESTECSARIMDVARHGAPVATPNATGPPRVEPALVVATALGWYACGHDGTITCSACPGAGGDCDSARASKSTGAGECAG